MISEGFFSPPVGLEPTTLRLTARFSPLAVERRCGDIYRKRNRERDDASHTAPRFAISIKPGRGMSRKFRPLIRGTAAKSIYRKVVPDIRPKPPGHIAEYRSRK
jgi:hypothetical protein